MQARCLAEVMDEGAGEPIGEEAGEFAPEGGGVVEVDEVGELVGEGLGEDGLGPEDELGGETDFALAGALTENAGGGGANDHARGEAGEPGGPRIEERLGAGEEGLGLEVSEGDGLTAGVGLTARGAAEGTLGLIEPEVIVAGEGEHAQGEDATEEDRLVGAGRMGRRGAGGEPGLAQGRFAELGGGVGEEEADPAELGGEVDAGLAEGAQGGVAPPLAEGAHGVALEGGHRGRKGTEHRSGLLQ